METEHIDNSENEVFGLGVKAAPLLIKQLKDMNCGLSRFPLHDVEDNFTDAFSQQIPSEIKRDRAGLYNAYCAGVYSVLETAFPELEARPHGEASPKDVEAFGNMLAESLRNSSRW